MKVAMQDKAAALCQALAKVNEAAIPVVCRDRGIDRKEQASLARELFKELGLPCVSVTAPRYANAVAVEVHFPCFLSHSSNCWMHREQCEACRDNNQIRLKLCEILARAFPQHDDRSDSQADYFDAPWVVYPDRRKE